ncbi:putative reverse transcriptase domain-containing protein [Tanacetum coccineum]
MIQPLHIRNRYIYDLIIPIAFDVLGATSIHVLEDDLNDLKWTWEEDGVVETLDPQFLLGSELLEIIDATSFDLLLEPILIISFSFSEVLLLGAVFLTTIVVIGFLGGTTIVEVILVKGHIFPSIVKALIPNIPIVDSPVYIADSNLEEDEEDPEEDPVDYPADRGDDDDDDDESSDDDEDDDDDVEEDEDEEEEMEHPASADSVPLPIHRVTARMSIQEQPPTPFWFEAEIARLLDIPSPLSPWSSPLPQIPSPPLPMAKSLSTSHSLPLPPTIILSYTRAFVAIMRVAAPFTYILAPRSKTPPSETPPSWTLPLLPIPLPTPSPPMLLPSTVCRAGVFEVTLPPRKRLCIALGLRYEVGESSSAPRPIGGFRADYGFVPTLDDEIRRDPERDDTDEIYGRLGDAQDDRSLMSGRLNMLFRDRRAHARTALLMEREARLSHGDCSLTSSRPRSTSTACGDTKTDEYTTVTGALTWWNSHVRTIGHDDAYALTWTDLKKNMTDKYCPKGEIKKLEAEMFPEESNKIKRYVGGLPDMIHGSVIASKPKTMQEVIEIATELIDKKIRTFAERQTENKRKQDDNRQQQQQQNKRQNTGRAYTTGSGQKPTCYKCGAHGHFKRDCPKLKNNNHGNQVGNGNAPAKVYAVGHAGTNPDLNVITVTLLELIGGCNPNTLSNLDQNFDKFDIINYPSYQQRWSSQ